MDNNATAWMLRKDGMAIPVVTHIYADKNEVDELLALAYFLWKNESTQSKIEVGVFLDVWSYHTLAWRMKSRIFVYDEVVKAIKQYLSEKPYIIFPEEFAKIIAARYSGLLRKRGRGEYINTSDISASAPPLHGKYPFFKKHYQDGDALWWLLDWGVSNQINDKTLIRLGWWLIHFLETLFIRARYGGMYNTVEGCRDMYFRVSEIDDINYFPTTVILDEKTELEHYKIHFNWYPVIYNFVEKHAYDIDTITIVRDYESTKSDDIFIDSENRPFDKMPIFKFLHGNGSIDLKNTICREVFKLKNGDETQ